MTLSVDTNPSARRTLTVCGGAHALHDGFTDLLNVLYPLLQAQFGLTYAAIGALKMVYSGAMASGQIPSGWLAGRIGGVIVLVSGTALVAVGYGLAGLTGSLYGVVAGLLLAGLGGSDPASDCLDAGGGCLPGLRSRTALGTYNFTGDVGKVLLPALFALIAASLGWQQALIVVAALAMLGAGVILATLQPPTARQEEQGRTAPLPAKTGRGPSGSCSPSICRTVGAYGVPDLPALPAADKGADLPTIGLALSLLFAGGAAGKLVMGWLGARLGVVLSVVLTEGATTVLILAILPLSLTPALVLLPLVGVMLNGTSSVLYGTVPEFVIAERRTHAFAVFYTGGSIAGATSPFLFGLLGDFIGLQPALVGVGALALLTVPLVWALRPAFRTN